MTVEEAITAQEVAAMGDTDAAAKVAAPAPDDKAKPAAAEKTEVNVRGRRERKQPDLFTPAAKVVKKGPESVAGDGTALREIEPVKAEFDKVPAGDDLLKLLHKTMYGSEGKASVRKKEVLNFQGLKGTEDGKDATAQVVERSKKTLATLTVSGYTSILDVLCLPRGSGEEGTKEARAARILSFLENPSADGVSTGKKSAAKKAAAAPKKATPAPKTAAAKTVAGAKPATAAKKGAGEKPAPRKRKAAVKDVEDEEDEEAGSEDEGASPVAQPKKRARAAAPAKKAAAPAKKAAKKGKAAAAEASDEDDDMELGDLAKMPSDKALREAVIAIIAAEPDRSKVTLKTVRTELMESKGLSEAFVKKKKPLIKDFAMEYLKAAGGQPPASSAAPLGSSVAPANVQEDDAADDGAALASAAVSGDKSAAGESAEKADGKAADAGAEKAVAAPADKSAAKGGADTTAADGKAEDKAADDKAAPAEDVADCGDAPMEAEDAEGPAKEDKAANGKAVGDGAAKDAVKAAAEPLAVKGQSAE